MDEISRLVRPECPNCHRLASVGARFCSACGTPLATNMSVDDTSQLPPQPATQEQVVSAPPLQVPVGEAVLVVTRGPDEGARFPLNGDLVTVGRASDADVFLDDVTVSRAHAEFLHGTEGWLLRDVGSLNGTYVGRERVDSRRLASGDEVQIGKYRFVFIEGGGAR